MLFCRCGCVTKPRSLCLAGSLATKLKSQVYSKVSEVTLGPFLVFFATFWARNWVLFCRCECVTKPCNLCFAGSLATKLKSLIFLSRVSEVTLGPFLVFFCYDLGTKLGAVLPLRMRHKAMQLVLGRLAGNKSEKSQFYQSFNQSFNFIVGFQK